jgi:hypothetical protein
MSREIQSVMGIDWRQLVLSAQKHRRKTVGFGKYNKKERAYEDEVYIREMGLAAGGIGCSIWDGMYGDVRKVV